MYLRLRHVVLKILKANMYFWANSWCRIENSVEKAAVFLHPLYVIGLKIVPREMEKSISSFRGVWCTFLFLLYFWYKFLLSNSVDPDQTPHSAASDLCLHCLPRSPKRDARLIWVKDTVMILGTCHRQRTVTRFSASLLDDLYFMVQWLLLWSG